MTISRTVIIAPLPRCLKATITCVVLALAVISPFSVAAQDAAKAERELQTLRARISQLDREMASDKRSQDSLSQKIVSTEKTLAQKARAARLAEAAVKAQKNKVAEAQRAQAQANALVKRGQRDLASALRASYMAGNPGPLQMLFSVDQAAPLLRLNVDTAALAAALQNRVAQLLSTIAQLAEAEKILAAEAKTLEARSSAASKALSALKKTQEQRRRELARLKQRGSKRGVALALARAQQAKVEKLLDELRSTLSQSPMKYERGKPFKQQLGKLPWPLRGKLLAQFGGLKNGGPLTWSGWWIEAPEGADVRAVADGRVVYVGWVQRYGLVVIVDHAGPYLSLYGHLQEARVELGTVVGAGTHIASAGNSGGHDRSGVYFEIRQGANTVDPKKWLIR